jgi:hypothetical protein
MPRIEDRLIKAVIYLYESADAAERGEPGGSGFLVGEPTTIPGAVYLFAVTNAHVAKSCPVVRTTGPPDKRVFIRQWGENGGWYRHPDQDDVVVTPIGFAPKDARDFYLDYVPREWFVTPENFTHASMDGNDPQPVGWPFGPGEEVVMLGRFLGYDGAQENQPAVRFGNLAMSPPVPIGHPWGFTQSSFVVECRSVSGYSGSPVFIFRTHTTTGAGLLPIGADRDRYGNVGSPRLLGVDWANLDRVGHNDYAIDWAEADAAASFPRRSGMLVAVPAWRLAELLDSKAVQNMKKNEEEKAAAAANGVNLDFEKFEDALRKVLSVPKSEVDKRIKEQKENRPKREKPKD